jgi:hypothetical protein
MDEKIDLWSIQPLSVLMTLRSDTVCMLKASPAIIEREYGAGAVIPFGWMWRETIRRTNLAATGQAVFWGWKSSPRDVRRFCRRMPVSPRDGQALLRLSIPASRILLSRFSLWETVMFGEPILLTAEEMARPEDRDEWPFHMIVETWYRVFDLELSVPSHVPPKEDLVQATFTELEPEWLVDAVVPSDANHRS